MREKSHKPRRNKGMDHHGWYKKHRTCPCHFGADERPKWGNGWKRWPPKERALRNFPLYA